MFGLVSLLFLCTELKIQNFHNLAFVWFYLRVITVMSEFGLLKANSQQKYPLSLKSMCAFLNVGCCHSGEKKIHAVLLKSLIAEECGPGHKDMFLNWSNSFYPLCYIID